MKLPKSAAYIIEQKKIELTGTGIISGNRYYDVATIPIHWIRETGEYICGCRDCVTIRRPNNLPSRCIFTQALKYYRENKEECLIKML